MAELVLTPAEIAWIINDADSNRLTTYPALNARFANENKATALAIIMAESGGNADKVSNGAYGLAQVKLNKAQLAAMGISDPAGQLINPHVNVRVMAMLSTSGNNFRLWTSYKNGAYRKHLADARSAMQKPVNPTNKINQHDEQLAEEQSGGIEGLMNWFGHGLFRVGVFVGGGVLIISAITLAAKKGIK